MILASIATQQANATITFSTGSGSAVTSVDRSANFDAVRNNDNLSNYSENLLSITTDGTAHLNEDPFNIESVEFHSAGAGFHCAGVNMSWVTIKATGRKIIGVEFLYGNIWSALTFGGQRSDFGKDSAIIEWKTSLDGDWVSVGSQPVGTVIGFSDPTGFDYLLLRAVLSTGSGDNNQAIALDNLEVQLAPIPEPSTWIAGIALTLPFGVQVFRHLCNRKQVS